MNVFKALICHALRDKGLNRFLVLLGLRLQLFAIGDVNTGIQKLLKG